MLMKVIDAPLRQAGAVIAQSCADCPVRSEALFGVLGSGTVERAGEGVESVRLLPGQRVYAQGFIGGSLFTVREGIVRFERVTEAGDRRIVRLAGRGGLIGQEALLHQGYADEAVACTEVQVCRIPKAVVERLAVREPTLHRELMRRWQSSLEAAEEWTAELTSGTTRRRVLQLVARLAELAGPSDCIWLPPRHEMGVMLDMAFETASRVIGQLRRERILETYFPAGARVDRALLAQALHRENNRM
jgi:CRP-like cAMP-binding protein